MRVLKDILTNNSFIYFSISILLLIAFVSCLKLFLGGFTPWKTFRGIDAALSKSHLSQVFILAFLIVFIFTFLYFICLIINSLYNITYKVSFWNALGHFLAPGSFGKEDGIENGWVFVINIFGMILMTGLLISVLSNLLERRVYNKKMERFLLFSKLFCYYW